MVLARGSWATRFGRSATHTFSVVNENVQFSSIPSTLVKAEGRAGSMRFNLTWLSLHTTVNMIVVLRNLDNPRGYLRSATLVSSGARLEHLPPSGTDVEVEIVVGSWTETGTNYSIEVHITTASWNDRFASTGQRSLIVLNEFLTVDPIQPVVVQAPGQPGFLPISLTYATNTPISVVVVVRHPSDSGNYISRVTQTTGNGVVGLPSAGQLDLRVQLGGWTTARPGYIVQVILTRGTWASRFVRSPSQIFDLVTAPGAFGGSAASVQSTETQAPNDGTFTSFIVVAAIALTMFVGTVFVAVRRQRRKMTTKVDDMHTLSLDRTHTRETHM